MKKIYLVVLCLFSVSAFSQTLWDSTYYGNGKTGFGGTVGEGSLHIKFTPDSVIFTFTKGPGDFNDAVVVYIQANVDNPQFGEEGFTSTATFTDFSDPLRAALSGYDGTNRSILNFPTGFKPTQALAFDANFGGFYWLQENGLHDYGESANIQPVGDKQSTTYRLSIPYGGSDNEEDPNVDETFRFLVTYLSTSAYRSNEFMGDVGPSANIGWNTYNPTTYHSGTAPANPVPVTLINFIGSNNNDKVNLQWTTAQESNIDRYDILRSADGKDFQKIGAVNATNNLLEQLYHYDDVHPLVGDNFYKLGIVSKDGQVEFSKIILLKAASAVSFKAYTTSSNRVLKIELNDAGSGNLLIEMSNSVGQKIFQTQVNSNGTNQYSVDLHKTLATGIYVVTISKDGEKYSKMILVK